MANVYIDEIVSRVDVVDAEEMLSPAVLSRIIDAVVRELDARQQLEAQRDADKGVVAGASRLAR